MKDTLRLIGILFVLSASVQAETQPGYVILTTTGIVAQSAQLTNFVTSKEARGFTVSVVDNRSTAQGGWGGGTGNTAAENIRTWLEANYTNSSSEIVIDYVLLIGNPHPQSGDVPMKLCDPLTSPDEDGTNGVPTDLYYASLNANWDVNTNGIYGQWSDLDTNVSPWNTEFVIGRIPYYGSISNLDAILKRIIDYESETAASAFWRGKVLLPFDMYGADSYWIYTDGIAEKIRNDILIPQGWQFHRIYDRTNGIPETLGCVATNVLSVLTNNSVSLILWFSHGTATSTYGQVLDSSNAQALLLSHPVITFQASCQNAEPETTNNVAYALLQTSAVATIAGTRMTYYTSWYAPGSNNGFLYGFAQRVVANKMGTGDALFDYKNNNAPGTDERWKNVLGYNVYGCPTIGIMSVRFAGPAFSF